MIILSRHLPRILTGSLLLVVASMSFWLSGPYFFSLLMVFTLFGLWEFYSMFWSDRAMIVGRLLGLLLGGSLLTVAWIRPDLTSMFLGLCTVTLACYFLFNWAANDSYRFTRVAILGAGLLYIPMLLIPTLEFNLKEKMFLACAAIASDTAAYFLGMAFGKHKIWPKVSPKKSVEGSLAGLFACTLVCTGYGALWGKESLFSFMVLALILGIMAQLGDFFESALKRSRLVKDSGTVLPGHGGVLDRIDSLLFLIPTYTCAKMFWTFFE